MGNVINLVPEKVSADEVLESCKGEYSSVLVLGWGEDNSLQARTTQGLDSKELVYIIELFKQAVLTSGYRLEEEI
tara:strand:- start:1730 stop:1954 length:225 start_codon:yes stop_codon:yes gene_type:complete